MDSFFNVASFALPVNNSGMGNTLSVECKEIGIPSDYDPFFGNGEWQNVFEVVNPQETGIDKRKHIIAMVSQRDGYRVVDMLITKKPDNHVSRVPGMKALRGKL
jgi:hypothetical protein